MKHLSILTLAGLLAASLIACGPSKAEQEQQRQLDSIRQADSLAAAQHAQDSIDWYSFTSKDLSFFELHGHVKKLKIGKVTYTFSIDGTLTSASGIDPFDSFDDDYDNLGDIIYEIPHFSRDSEGYIVEAASRGAAGIDNYKWQNGRLMVHISGSGSYEDRMAYHYDDNGRITSTTGKYNCEEETGSISCTYTYIDEDMHGNWTKRKAVTKSVETNTTTESRSITYYPMEEQ